MKRGKNKREIDLVYCLDKIHIYNTLTEKNI